MDRTAYVLSFSSFEEDSAICGIVAFIKLIFLVCNTGKLNEDEAYDDDGEYLPPEEEYLPSWLWPLPRPLAICQEHLEELDADSNLQSFEVTDILEILRTCISLCQRNSPRLDPDEAESLSFQLLDSFCEPLVDSHDHSIIRYKDEERAQEGETACKIQWKVSKSHRNTHILRKLISAFIKENVEGMIGYINVRRVREVACIEVVISSTYFRTDVPHGGPVFMPAGTDNETQEFGDFKPTILGMLGTYDFERWILDKPKGLWDLQRRTDAKKINQYYYRTTTNMNWTLKDFERRMDGSISKAMEYDFSADQLDPKP
ncbi:hypothetical protein CQW23_22830 [Capsicum baccatum]|uniref:Uncharacterized protein n=1 Tax=Capsicum baccatum TaxID=33114 RepID=A0A2G2W1Z1_CAPBA|nr:hypothetical protein CQW23_22830 [Capsicum baccatum]